MKPKFFTNNETNKIHTRAQAEIFRGKVSLLQLKRGFENLLDKRVKQFPLANNLEEKPMIAESKTPLWTESEPQEQFLPAGKVHNLRLAVKKLNGLEIPADEIFSFWKYVGQANSLKGYVEGRELREAIRDLNLKLIVLGAELEGADLIGKKAVRIGWNLRI